MGRGVTTAKEAGNDSDSERENSEDGAVSVSGVREPEEAVCVPVASIRSRKCSVSNR